MRIVWNGTRKTVRLKLEKGESPKSRDLRTVLAMMQEPTPAQKRADDLVGQTVDAMLLGRMRAGDWLSHRQVQILGDYFEAQEAANTAAPYSIKPDDVVGKSPVEQMRTDIFNAFQIPPEFRPPEYRGVSGTRPAAAVVDELPEFCGACGGAGGEYAGPICTSCAGLGVRR